MKLLPIAAIKAAVDVPRVLREAGHDIAAGKRGRCCFHGGDNPSSLTVSRDGAKARCWACGWHGDTIDAAQALLNIDRAGAIDYCAQLAGMRPLRRVRSAEIRRAVRAQQRKAAAEAAAAGARQRAWEAAVERLHDISGSIGVMESIWSRDPDAVGWVAQHAMDDLSWLYLERDIAGDVVEERWAALNAPRA